MLLVHEKVLYLTGRNLKYPVYIIVLWLIIFCVYVLSLICSLFVYLVYHLFHLASLGITNLPLFSNDICDQLTNVICFFQYECFLISFVGRVLKYLQVILNLHTLECTHVLLFAGLDNLRLCLHPRIPLSL